MSASGRMSKKVELKRKWEDRLKDYKEPILYARSVLIWKRPIDYGVFLSLVTLVIWFYLSIETTAVTLASLFVVLWTLVSWAISVASFRVPWNALVPQEPSNADHFGDIIGFFVQVRFAVVDTIEDMQRFRAANPTRFVLQITVSGLLLAYIGSLVSGQFLLVALIYALLLLPGAVANGVPERVAAVAEPHIKVYREKLAALLSGVLQQVDQQLKKAKPAAASSASTDSQSAPTSAASSVTSAPTTQEGLKQALPVEVDVKKEN